MDFVEINKFTLPKDIDNARNHCYQQKSICKLDALRLIVYACKKMYGLSNTSKIIHGIGVDKIDLSI